jgi:hypothetical protein
MHFTTSYSIKRAHSNAAISTTIFLSEKDWGYGYSTEIPYLISSWKSPVITTTVAVGILQVKSLTSVKYWQKGSLRKT